MTQPQTPEAAAGVEPDDGRDIHLPAGVAHEASPSRQRPPVVEAWRCAPVLLDGHRWPCPAGERRGEPCSDQGCHR